MRLTLDKALMRFFWIVLLFVSINSGSAQNLLKKNVLFIGNSLTYYGGMPNDLKAILETTNQKINVEFIAYPGMSLEDHLDSIIEEQTDNGIRTRKKRSDEQTVTEEKLLSRKWDVVILQDQPVRVLIPEFRKYSTEIAVERIKKLVNHPECKLVLFKTWLGNGVFPTRFCYPTRLLGRPSEKENYCSGKFNNLVEQFASLSADYDSVALATGIDKIDIGNKYNEILKQHPTLELYDEDSHPTKLGTYLNACLFYKFLTGNKSASITYYAGLGKANAVFLQRLAD